MEDFTIVYSLRVLFYFISLTEADFQITEIWRTITQSHTHTHTPNTQDFIKEKYNVQTCTVLIGKMKKLVNAHAKWED